jgi:hypothetical protein
MREFPELGDPRSSIGSQNVINNDCWIIILSMLFAFFLFFYSLTIEAQDVNWILFLFLSQSFPFNEIMHFQNSS